VAVATIRDVFHKFPADQAPTGCSRCHYPFYRTVDGFHYCFACWLELRGGHNRSEINQNRYTRPEHRAYPQYPHDTAPNWSREAWDAYYGGEGVFEQT